MALKKCNVVAYKTSDGQKFIGGESKEAAQRHEDEIQHFLTVFRTTESVFKICGIEDQLTDIDESSILAHFYGMAEDNTDSGIEEKFEGIVETQMDIMLQSAQCASDLADIDDMLDMICDVIHDLGGTEAVVKLYNYHMKKRR
jgi:hypothetical protein